jgi:hypothetical protein
MNKTDIFLGTLVAANLISGAYTAIDKYTKLNQNNEMYQQQVEVVRENNINNTSIDEDLKEYQDYTNRSERRLNYGSTFYLISLAGIGAYALNRKNQIRDGFLLASGIAAFMTIPYTYMNHTDFSRELNDAGYQIKDEITQFEITNEKNNKFIEDFNKYQITTEDNYNNDATKLFESLGAVTAIGLPFMLMAYVGDKRRNNFRREARTNEQN